MKRTHKKTHKLRFWLMILATFMVAGVAFVIYNQYQNRPPRAVKLTAVGDSLTQGVGDPKGRGGYTYLIRKKVNDQNPHVKMSTANFGISGETTNQINNRVVHSAKLRRSLRTADVITVTTGGNDLLHFLKNNVVDNNRTQLNGRLTHYQASYRQRVSRLFTDIRKVNSHSPIFVFGIYNPVYVYFPQVSFISRAVAANNTVTKSVAQKHSQIYFIPINKPLSDGQYRTAKSRQRLRQRAAAIGNQSNDANEIEALLNGNATQSNRYLSTEDHFHPNQTGYQIMTNLLYKQLSQHLDWVKG